MFRYVSIFALSVFLASGSAMAAQSSEKTKECGKILTDCWKKALEVNCYPSPFRPEVCKKFKKNGCSRTPKDYSDNFIGSVANGIVIKCAGW
ncbi:hypothetical protein [Legionella shakespearei]|uniref:Uncharacterized protein n=1 Tax=Legionella shakespearei DSM 23087 TaxID=1122169 RepID=A0A0W0YQ99_9GAMM|nr:hypothetical protein [Legionella shakespearei]KTD59050.1 hypothetical protein Lsha_2082 [Legionella shakespearei DSM 23087]